jgi:hypothetical protein
MTDLIERASVFARTAHVNQRRKYTNLPYITHPATVAELVRHVGGTETMIAAAWLHDVVEDCGVELGLIDTTFGREVADLVGWLTDASKPSDGDRAARKKIDLAHTAGAPPAAKTVKLADLIDNSSSILAHDKDFARVYLWEKQLLLDVLRDGDRGLWVQASNVVRAGLIELGELWGVFGSDGQPVLDHQSPRLPYEGPRRVCEGIASMLSTYMGEFVARVIGASPPKDKARTSYDHVLPIGTCLGQLRITNVHVYYNGPKLFTVVNSDGRHFMAVAVDESEQDETWLYAPMSPVLVKSDRAGVEIDVGKLFHEPPGGKLVRVITHRGDTCKAEWIPAAEVPEIDLPRGVAGSRGAQPA